jgi:myo-inositol-1(or 4)-monophosphatase
MIPAELSIRVDFARRVAREAGALAQRYFLREIDFVAESKGPQDWVSAADVAVEDLLRLRLVQAFPGDTVYGEERGGELGTHAWLIDPIDGTINFVHGVRYWCVSIAFVVAGERRIGLVYDPSLDELFWATKDGGAWCDGTRIHVAPRDRLDYSLVCVGYVPRHSLDEHLRLKRLLHEAGAAVKDMGAGALMLAHVAAGRYDAFLEPHMNAWDALAGLLLIDEAGGRALPYPAPGGLASGGAGARRGAGYFRRAGPSVAARRQRRLSAATPIT